MLSHLLHIHARILKITFLILFCSLAFTSIAQSTITANTVDGITKNALPYVNIGIKHKNIGTISSKDGSFILAIPEINTNDTLTFSMVGYTELNIPVKKILSSNQKTFILHQVSNLLSTVTVYSKKRIEKKIGITNSHALMHFIDGSINQNDIFEIAQLIETMDTGFAKITSLNLTITDPREDSGTFRINFYGFDGSHPTERIVEKNILQTKKIIPGNLLFDLSSYNIYLKGNFVIGLEFIPSVNANDKPIHYEVKLGGKIRSYVSSHSQADWRVPPHHYKLFITELVSAETKNTYGEENEEKETRPSVRLFSQNVQDSFSVFVRLPEDYEKHKNKKNYPVIYLLDANAYFDIVSNAISDIAKDKTTQLPILIGIGYNNFIENDSLRNRDFTYPIASASDSFSVSGGGNKFLAFIENELIPLLDKKYRTDTTERTIMGHSLGGYFTLFALQQELKSNNPIFKHFIAASPSIHYAQYYLVNQFVSMNVSEQQKSRDLFITMGSGENSEEGKVTTEVSDQFNTFIKKLSDKYASVININGQVYPNLYHMETAVRTFNDGLKKLMLTGDQRR